MRCGHDPVARQRTFRETKVGGYAGRDNPDPGSVNRARRGPHDDEESRRAAPTWRQAHGRASAWSRRRGLRVRRAAGSLGGSDEEGRAQDRGNAKPVSQVLRLAVETSPGVIEFDKKRLSARAGRVAFELTNDKRKGHNIRIHTGDACCFPPGSKDIGGTRTIGTGHTRAVLDLKPGTYTYLCSAGGHWRTRHGTLVVR